MRKNIAAAVIPPLLLAACAGSPARRHTSIKDINGIKTRIETVDRELTDDVKPAGPGTAAAPAAPQSAEFMMKEIIYVQY